MCGPIMVIGLTIIAIVASVIAAIICLNNDIHWFDNKEECLKFFIEHDWEGDYSWHSSEQHEFISKVIEFLK